MLDDGPICNHSHEGPTWIELRGIVRMHLELVTYSGHVLIQLREMRNEPTGTTENPGKRCRRIEARRVADPGQLVDPFKFGLDASKIRPGFVLVPFPTTLSIHSEFDRSVEFDRSLL